MISWRIRLSLAGPAAVATGGSYCDFASSKNKRYGNSQECPGRRHQREGWEGDGENRSLTDFIWDRYRVETTVADFVIMGRKAAAAGRLSTSPTADEAARPAQSG